MNWKMKCRKVVILLSAAVMSVALGGCTVQKTEPLPPAEMPEGAIGGAESTVYAVDPLAIGLLAVVVLAAAAVIAALVAKNKKH